MRAASGDVHSSVAMDHDGVYCMSPPGRTGEYLLHFDNSNNCFKSHNKADAGSQRGLSLLWKFFLDLTHRPQVAAIRSQQT
jgi:hypothetical protein